MLTEMKGIVMEFGPVRAVDNVDLTIQPGEIVGLLGENGAGKSTLMNILAGTYPAVSGKILLDGKEVRLNSAKQAMQHGIRFIHQELNLCKDLKVFENLFLAEELRTKFGLLDKKEMIRRSGEVFRRMKVEIDPEALVETLQPAEQQLVEIARSLLFQCQLIIMDEPSTALSTHEIENLFDIMRQLKSEGVSFIYISHKMPELFEICDTYYVLRDGRLIANGKFEDIDEHGITELMLGHQLADDTFADKKYYGTDEVVLSVRNLCGQDFRDISFDLHRGEIIAITGLQGSGRDTLADALFGAAPCIAGEVHLNGEHMKNGSPIIRHMKAGIAMVPRSRKERGILNTLSIYDNTSIGYLNTKFRGGLINIKEEQKRFERQTKTLKVKTENPKNPITSLSGGNQQKVILGRWLETEADVLLFDNPTQGIDVGTKYEIYHLILRLAESGKAIIVFSAEFPEIYKVADSCMVLYKGQVNAVLSREEMTEKRVMYYSTGANLEGEKHA